MNENPFDQVSIDEDQANRIAILKGEFKNLFASFADYLQGSRYTSLAVTALEEASMWANKSIAFEQNVALKDQSCCKEDASKAAQEGCCGSGQCCKE